MRGMNGSGWLQDLDFGKVLDDITNIADKTKGIVDTGSDIYQTVTGKNGDQVIIDPSSGNVIDLPNIDPTLPPPAPDPTTASLEKYALPAIGLIVGGIIVKQLFNN